MIELLLQNRLAPVARRQQRLYLWQRLTVTWLGASLAGLGLLLMNKLWGWDPSIGAIVLSGMTILATLLFYRLSEKQRPDFGAIARHIEKHHPDLQALLLTAVEQRAETADHKLNYLQERVINEALQHANQHQWIRAVSSRKLSLANYGRCGAIVIFAVVVSQLFSHTSIVTTEPGQGWLSGEGSYKLSVNPGDAEIESGAAVVITARFDDKVPAEATLLMGPSLDTLKRVRLTQILDDPVFGTLVPKVQEDLVYLIEYADRRSENYHLSVFTYPKLLRADATIAYPAYTNQPETTVKDTRRISVAEGSQVRLDFQLNKPVTSAQLIGKDGSVLDLSFSPDGSTAGRVQIEPVESLRYELKLVDADGRSNRLPPRFTIDVHTNQPAQLKATFPNRDLRPSPLEELTLEAEATDDYGITEYGVSYTVSGRETERVVLALGDSTFEKVNIQHTLALETLNVEPDQLLTYYYWAKDTGADQKSREATSDMYFVEIRPFEEVFQESQSSQQEQERQNQQQNQNNNPSPNRANEELIKLQKQIISATWNLKRQSDLARQTETFTEDIGTIHESQAQVLQKAQAASAQAEDPETAQALARATGHVESALEQLANAKDKASAAPLPGALNDEQGAYQEFLKLRRREHQVARARSSSQQSQSQSSANSSGQRSQQQLQQLELQQRENRYETERRAQLQNEQTTNQRENLQVSNRLRELARRQTDVSEKLKELQSELRQADEQRQEELRRELKRLREEQQQLLRDMDELQERMNQPENRQRMADANRQLSQTRQNMQRAAEEMRQNQLSQAVTSTSRAQRELEQTRDEFRQQTSNQFADQMRQMRDQAQQLDRDEKDIAEQLREKIEAQHKTLADREEQDPLAEQIARQRESAKELIDQMRDVSEQSEATEPLLSRKLYETLRENQSGDLDRSLGITGELVKRNFLPEAREMEKYAGQQIEELRQNVEDAAESILGSEQESLRQARRQLDDLIRQAQQEADAAQGFGQRSDDPNRLGLYAQNQQDRNTIPPINPNAGDQDSQMQNRANQNRDAQNRQSPNQNNQNSSEQNRSAQNQNPQQNRNSQTQNSQNRESPTGQTDPASPNDQNRNGQTNRQGQDPRSQRSTDRNSQSPRRSLRDPDRTARGTDRQFERPGERGGDSAARPFTGEEYRQWSDRLRDVEEMLERPEWQDELARIRQRARELRTEVKRQSKEPQWDLVRNQIIKPMVDLHRRLGEELALLQSDEALVPIDRDPVPQRYSELVRSYYEKLAGRED